MTLLTLNKLRTIVVFSGSNQRAVISFLRFAKSQQLRFFIIANGQNDNIFSTEYAVNVIHTREYNVLDINEISHVCLKVIKSTSVSEVLILPSSEFLNRFLLQNSKYLRSINVHVGLCSLEVYNKISDKKSFCSICSSYGLPVPHEYIKRPEAPPYVCKPKSYFLNNIPAPKPIIILTEHDLHKLSSHDEESFFYQEYIGGRSIYLLYYVYKNGTYEVFSQENLIQQSEGRSMILAKSSDYHLNNPITREYANVLHSEGFNGLVMVEIKLWEGKAYMIEANPRFWGPLQLVLDSGMSLLHTFAKENGLIANTEYPTTNYLTDIYYFWSGGLVQNRQTPPSFHLFNPSDFIDNYHKIITNEIYLKPDTINIYSKENHG